MVCVTCSPVPVSSKFNAAITPAISSDERDHEARCFFHVDIFSFFFLSVCVLGEGDEKGVGAQFSEAVFYFSPTMILLLY